MRALAETLVGVGIDVNLAPVVDLDIDPASQAIGALERSFSADPGVVIAQARATIEAHHDVGVRSVIKHFPGEGSGAGNTDFGFVDVTGTWSRTELEPFRALVGPGSADAVMVGHILNGQLDRDRPASLSRQTVSGLLRDELGWDGVVVSDDLQAGAITARFGQAEAVALAIEAGVDLLLFANQQVYEPDIVRQVTDIVVALVEDGRVPEARIDRSVARIERLRAPMAG
jgi:beta-N-acetylhexosaminidase